MLDQLITGKEIGSRPVGQQIYQFDLAGGETRIETLRMKGGATDGAGVRGAGSARKSWSFGARSQWSLGLDDILSVELGAGRYHTAQHAAVVTNPHDATALATAGVNWTHDEHWQLSLAWQQVSGAAHGAADRMAELANGAPLHEAGLKLAAAYVTGGRDDPHHATIGFEARRSSISTADLVQMNSGQRQDTQGSVVMRTNF